MSGRRAGVAGPDPRWLLLVPAGVYAVSYVVLAVYHGRPWLWGTVVHENGRYTLLETTLYASHFLGHVPVLATIALVTAGSWRCMSPPCLQPSRWLGLSVGLLLVALLVAATVVAIGHFGLGDTVAFLLQRRQRPDLDVEGGSWNLHLPSTMLQLALIPVVVYLARRVFARPLVPSREGAGLLIAAVATAGAVTAIVNSSPLEAVAAVWTDPRYLAHSVRELVTFPLTYYPIPLAILLVREPPARHRERRRARPGWPLVAAAVVFTVGFSYQVAVSLSHDIGELAQRPDFARGGRLDVPYLLASHSFEHVLDSVFFALLTVLLVWCAGAVGTDAEAP